MAKVTILGKEIEVPKLELVLATTAQARILGLFEEKRCIKKDRYYRKSGTTSYPSFVPQILISHPLTLELTERYFPRNNIEPLRGIDCSRIREFAIGETQVLDEIERMGDNYRFLTHMIKFYDSLRQSMLKG